MSKKKPEKKVFENEAYVMPEIDTLNFVTKSSTKEQRKAFDIGDVYINGAVCMDCYDYIRSKHRHDCVTCSCGSLSVDGGSWYVKRSSKDGSRYINVIEYFYDEQDE